MIIDVFRRLRLVELRLFLIYLGTRSYDSTETVRLIFLNDYADENTLYSVRLNGASGPPVPPENE